jgi:hypothetical protein
MLYTIRAGCKPHHQARVAPSCCPGKSHGTSLPIPEESTPLSLHRRYPPALVKPTWARQQRACRTRTSPCHPASPNSGGRTHPDPVVFVHILTCIPKLIYQGSWHSPTAPHNSWPVWISYAMVCKNKRPVRDRCGHRNATRVSSCTLLPGVICLYSVWNASQSRSW